MSEPGDFLLQYKTNDPGRLANPYYNFSSAAGIEYTIDIRRSAGDRVTIHGFSNGNPFEENAIYSVAVNSYRGNGGGGHLTKGAGITRDGLADRISWSTHIDLRYYLMQYLSKKDTLHPGLLENWQLIPDEWVKKSATSEKKLFH